MIDRLDAAAVAAAAVALADTEGVDAVSMRRVGAALGVSGMALYRHVAGRDDLLRRMVVHVARADPPVPGTDLSWRSTLEHLAVTPWEAFVRHPWLADAAVSPDRLVDAVSAAQTETVLGRLIDAGCAPDEAPRLLLGAVALVIGIARITLGATFDRPVEHAADDPAQPGAVGPRAALLRTLPLDAAGGRGILDTSLSAYLDGVAARLTGVPTADAPERKETP